MSENIFQIYHDKTLIPDYIPAFIKKLNPQYNYKLLDFEEGKQIIKENIKDDMLKQQICDAIDKMPRYCHKSDLLRYCLLYIYGGIYLDVDLQIIIPFNQIIPQDVDFCTAIGAGPNPYIVNGNKIHCGMANGIIMSKKENPILLDLIRFSLSNKHLFDKNPIFRGENVYYLFDYLRNETKKQNIVFEPFKILQIFDQKIYLLNTETRNIINYGRNCIVNHNTVVINPNNKNFIVPRQTSSYI